MAYFDIFTLIMVLLCSVIGAWGGFTQNILKIMSFIAALIVGMRYYFLLVPFLSRHIHIAPSLLNILAGLLTCLITLVICFLVSSLVDRLIKATPLASLDRILGLIFGAFIGLIVVSLILLCAHWLLDPPLFRQLTAHSHFFPLLTELHRQLLTWWSSTHQQRI